MSKDKLVKEIDREIDFYKRHIDRSRKVLGNLSHGGKNESRRQKNMRLSLLDYRQEHISYSKKMLGELNHERNKLLGVEKHLEQESDETGIFNVNDLVDKVEEAGAGIWKNAMILKKIGGGFIDQITGRLYTSKKAKKVYVVLAVLVTMFLIFRNKTSITGYSVLESVTNSNIISYVLLFILAAVVLFYSKSD